MTPEEAVPGIAVRFLRNGVMGSLVAVRDGRAEVSTDLGHITVDLAELVAADTRKTRGAGGRVSMTVDYDDDPLDDELDLHQLTVADVEPELTRFLSRAIVRGIHRVRIIHGKGSGAVRKEVQRVLKSQKRVEKFEYAQPREGSYGATVAWLR